MEEKPRHYLDRVNSIMYATFLWVFCSIFRYSGAKLTEIKDSQNTTSEDAKANRERFQGVETTNGLLGFIIGKYWGRLAVFIFFKFIETSLLVLNTYLTIELTNILDDKNDRTPEERQEDFDKIVPLMIMIVASATLRVIILFHNSYFSARIGFQIRAGISSAMFKKMLTTSLTSYGVNTPGKISAMIQVDVESIADLVNSNLLFWEGLFTLIYIFIIFGFTLGTPQLIIYGMTVLIFLILFLLGVLKSKFFMGYMIFKDQRLQLLKSVLMNVRMIKIKCLELYYNSKLTILRNLELSKLGLTFIAFAGLQTFPLLVNMIVPPLVFLFIDQVDYTSLSKKDLISFTLYFGMFFSGCSAVSSCATRFADSYTSCSRIHSFLISKDKESNKQAPENPNMSITIKDGEFFWGVDNDNENEVYGIQEPDSFVDIQQNINSKNGSFKMLIPSLEIKKGEFVVVLGNNGSGKSTFVYSILQEAQQTLSTDVRVKGSVSFLSQTPWVITDTIKENIVFGDEYNEQKLIKVLKLAQFWEDLKEMEKGIDTFCEENGANLSGGQRARLALARCFYHESEVMILDDPVKALDAKVTRNVLEGSLATHFSHRTKILTSNIPNHAKYADRVIIIESGKLVYNGDYRGATKHKIFAGIKIEENNSKREALESFYDPESYDSFEHKVDLAEEEQIATGRVSIKVYCAALWEYFSWWGGIVILILVFLAFGLYSSVQTMSYDWIDKRFKGESTTSFILEILGMSFFSIILLFAAVLVTLRLGLRLSSRMHFKMLFAVLHAKVAEFLDIRTTGFLLNRFTNDLDFSDRSLPIFMFSVLVSLLVNMFMIATFISAAGSAFFIIDLIVFILIIVVCQNYYLKSNNNLNRLLNVSKTPIVQLASGISTGIAEVRAMHKEEYLEDKYLGFINMNIKYYPIIAGLESGFGFYVNLLNYAMLTIPGFMYINSQVKNSSVAGKTLDLSVITLFLQNVNNIGLNLSGLLSGYNQIETLFVNVERCKEFERIEPEVGYRDIEETKRVHQTITQSKIEEHYSKERELLFPRGEIMFKDVSATYPGREIPALSKLHFKITSGEKVAVVGRTGSGKTTLAKLLWRGLQIDQGGIFFDGQDLQELDLMSQRSEMSIVSQEISLIDGTLKENLNPFFDESVIYKVNLEQRGCNKS